MHELAVVSKIQNIQPIPGKDRIELATVENYNTIVEKGLYKVGDSVVYVFYDAVLPVREEFEFLRKRCFCPKYNGFRIRPMKMGEAISEGLVLPMSILDKDKTYKVGSVVTDELGIVPYESDYNPNGSKPVKPPKFFLMRFAPFRKVYNAIQIAIYKRKTFEKSYDSWLSKSNETNIEKVWDCLKDSSADYIVTEKVEGAATVYSLKKNTFKVFSHNWRVKSGAWYDYAVSANVKKKLKSFCKAHKLDGIAISGEIVGPGIQNNIYNLNEYKFYIYGGFHTNGTKLTWDEMLAISNEIGIPTVPYIKTAKVTDFDSCEAILKDADGKSTLCNVKREGFVWRTSDGSSSFKAKSRNYKIWYEKKIDD